ncbi:hypothetical protein [Burkholderia lata]|uniref:hypothetical protein n=1 Tax=Burkholderia lata (strain ATCC 17760 / DSM 23089 / LMG 22485 / NCIMB 9086 / R18194 / 383) TaxID=482957 RepID=UPI001582F2D8|nr:hypothetical protein [Burkholderia lata]
MIRFGEGLKADLHRDPVDFRIRMGSGRKASRSACRSRETGSGIDASPAGGLDEPPPMRAFLAWPAVKGITARPTRSSADSFALATIFARLKRLQAHGIATHFAHDDRPRPRHHSDSDA